MSYRHKVSIIGGNFAGYSAARELSRLSMGALDITLLDPASHFNWTPNIHEILSGVKQQSSVSVSRSSMLKNLGVNFMQKPVVSLGRPSKTLALDSGEELQFDACIIACGYAARYNNLPSGHFLFRKAQDVQLIRDALNKQLHRDKSVNITIVGGGFTGVEALGELLRKSTFDSRFNITVVESADRLVRDLDGVISHDIIKLAQPYGVNFRLACKVLKAHPTYLELSDGSTLDSDLTIWSSGGSVPEFLKKTQFAKKDATGIAVNSYLQMQSRSECFVAGDIANISFDTQDSNNIQRCKSLSKQSYHAIDMGKLAAQNAVNYLQQVQLQSFKPNPKPVLLAFGDINTYLISGGTVLASPLLAATKEALYQVSMHKLMAGETLYQRKKSFVERLTRSAVRLLLPELQPTTLINILSRSRVLKKGSTQDLLPLFQGARSTFFDRF